MKALFRTFKYLKPYLHVTVLALIGLLLSTAGNLVVPAISQRIIDEGIIKNDITVMTTMTLFIIGIATLRALFTFLQGYMSAKISQSVAYDLRNLLYEKIQRLSFSYHDRAQTGQLLTRTTSDVELVQQFLGAATLQALGALALLIGSLVLMVQISPNTAAVLLVLIPISILLFIFFFRKARPLFTEGQKRLEQLNITLQENLVGVRVVRAFVRHLHEIARFTQRNQAVMDVQLQIGNVIATALPLVFFIANLATLAVTWIGGIQVINGEMSLGSLVAFTNYILMVIFPLFMFSFLIAHVTQAAAGAERIFEVLDAPMEIQENPDAPALPAIQGQVIFKNVWFRYFERQPWILKEINFVAKPGQKIALLGATGSGKSTIINLVPRFYDVSKGKVLIDGHDIRKVALESLRRQVGIVLQETLLFGGTIQENIAFGNPEATLDQIIAAAQAAQAHDFIMSFPRGYETPVGERGTMLSGGQKQRIAIARTLLTDPRILILDDATSSVDFQTELKLRQALEKLMENRTSFIIAQRVTTVRNADLILVLEQGNIVAQGTHSALLEESALYAELYYSQLEGAGETHEDFLVYDESISPEVSL